MKENEYVSHHLKYRLSSNENFDTRASNSETESYAGKTAGRRNSYHEARGNEGEYYKDGRLDWDKYVSCSKQRNK